MQLTAVEILGPSCLCMKSGQLRSLFACGLGVAKQVPKALYYCQSYGI